MSIYEEKDRDNNPTGERVIHDLSFSGYQPDEDSDSDAPEA